MSMLDKIKQYIDVIWNYISILRNKVSFILATLKANSALCIKILIPCIIILAGYCSCSIRQNAVRKDIQDIFAISSQISTYFSDKPNYWGLCNDYIIKNKLISDKNVIGQNIVLSSKKNITIGSGIGGDVLMPFSQTFDVVLKNLNKAQCMDYAEEHLTDSDLLLLSKISIINDKGEFIFEWGTDKSLPIKKYGTKDYCADENNAIVWTIRK